MSILTMLPSLERIPKNKSRLSHVRFRRANIMIMLVPCLIVAVYSLKLTYMITPHRHTSGTRVRDSSRKLTTQLLQYRNTKNRRELANRTQDDQVMTSTARRSPSLDFLIAGFPKCGTTTLLYAFGKHEETSISSTEKCSFANPNHSDGMAVGKLTQALIELDPSPSVKRGIKCPTGIKNYRAIERLMMHSPDTQIIVGLRHPVKFFQSYYNYRVTEAYDKNLKEKLPPVETLVGNNHWKGVSTEAARFELPLMQLGKTDMTVTDMDQLANRPHTAVVASPFRIFLYSLEQLEDSDEGRAERFRDDMQKFLGLTTPIPPFGHENLNHFVGKKAHPETINICDAKYRKLRATLISQSSNTREWIRNQFIANPDVTVGGEDYFLELMDTWGVDPCGGIVLANS